MSIDPKAPACRAGLIETLADIDARIGTRDPDFEALEGGAPLGVEETLVLMRPGEAIAMLSTGAVSIHGDDVPGTLHPIMWDGRGGAVPLESGEGLQRDMRRLRGSFIADPSCNASGDATGGDGEEVVAEAGGAAGGFLRGLLAREA